MSSSNAFSTRKAIPWRLFRHEAATESRIPPWAYVLLFTAALFLSYGCQQRFGAVAIWPANGVLVAAMLLLKRAPAIAVTLACLGVNLAFNYFVRGSQGAALIVFPLLNVVEAIAVALIARRYCGAALRLKRPVRLARFVLLAAIPSVIASALIGLNAIHIGASVFWLNFASWVSVELLGILVVTPSILMLALGPSNLRDLGATQWRGFGLIVAASVFTALVCLDVVPLPIAAILPALLLVSLRISPRQAALMVLLISFTTVACFLVHPTPFEAFAFGAPPADRVGVADITLRLPSFYLFLSCVLLVVLSTSTVVNETQRLQTRLRERAAEARRDANRLSEALVQGQQANEAKRRFLNMISHELKTPLGQATGLATLLETERNLPDAARNHLEKIRRANAHALELVEDMIDFACAKLSIAPEPFDLVETVEAVLNHVRANTLQKAILVRSEDCLGGDAQFVGDARRIRQVLRILMHNAVKFTDVGEIGIRAEATSQGARLTVFDTGCGIAPERIGDLTEVFVQGDSSETRIHDGAGVGLALAGRLVDALGGCWSIKSEVGCGTRVIVDLPMESIDLTRSCVETTERAPRILVVDDHPTNREVLGLMLRALGCETEYAADGLEAVEAAQVGAFDIVLMDLRMPLMDGYEASRQIRALTSTQSAVPIIAVSAECREESQARCSAAGIDDFLSKPVGQATLIETVGKWLDPGHVAATRTPLARSA